MAQDQPGEVDRVFRRQREPRDALAEID